ncbi:MAG: hypothetical protein AB7O78_15280 [Thermoleophilia bacterium]
MNFANDSVADLGSAIVRYEVTIGGSTVVAPGGPAATQAQVTVASGSYTVLVHAVQSDGVTEVAGADKTAPLLVDRAAPTVSVSLNGAATGGFYRSLTLRPVCSDDNPLPVGACPADVGWTQNGNGLTGPSFTVTDVAGKVSLPASAATFNFDNTAPTAFGTVGPGAQVSSQPTFTWSRSSDATSGIDRYVVQWQRADGDFDPATGWLNLATVNPASSVGDYSAPPSTWGGAVLPEFTPLVWRVVAFDKAGNSRTATPAQGKDLLIDPTVPPAPLITGGPSTPTQNTSPTFTWDGTGATFRWYLTKVGASAALRSGAGTAKQADLSALPDGAYVFHVTQFTAAARESEEALRSFVVDTTPPDPPAILTRPTFPALGDAVFTWATEPGAYSRWNVVDRNSTAVVPPTDTPITSATLPSLAEDAYVFSVQQIDAAGNVSPATVEPFTVIAPLVAPSPSSGLVTLLPKQNARRLKPKAGKTIFSRTPFLRWTGGPKGTKLFNLQIFRVSLGKNAKTPKVTKVLSVFPKRTVFRVPKSKTRPKTCYVWRVWPYTGSEFTPKPLGVSNYCIASQRVLKKKAAVIAKRKAAKVAARSRR